jgi:hypothetical protein
MTRGLLLPLAGLVTVALALGVWLGLNATLPSETEIIEAAAADYVAETGGARTDCAARPSPVENVRLVVVCDGVGDRSWVVAYDSRGREVAVEPDSLDEEPTT